MILCKTPREGGFALISAIIALAILLMLASSMIAISQFGVKRSRTELERSQAEAFADAVLIQTMLALQDTRQQERPRVDGAPSVLHVLGYPVTVRMEDEFGKIDLNAASPTLLSRLFQTAGVSAVKADALAAKLDAWRTGGKPERAPGLFGLASVPRRIFRFTNEVQLVDPELARLYPAIEPALTVYSGQDHIDPSVAPYQALMAGLGISREQALLMVKLRGDGASGDPLSIVRGGKVVAGIDQRGWPFHVQADMVLERRTFCLEAYARSTRNADQPFMLNQVRVSSAACSVSLR